jgi:predicted RNase H-like nuclease (RuvC/YqgF family)
MKIHIDIDLQPSNTEELDRLARFIKSLDTVLNAMELEIEKYRQRLERVEEMTTRFDSGQEEG